MQDSQMKIRMTERESLKIPVKLEVMRNGDSSAKIFPGYTLNLSRHGLGLNVGTQDLIHRESEIIVHMDVDGPFYPMKVPAKLVWFVEAQCGLRFLQELENIQEIIQKSSSRLEVQTPNLRKFYPYVGGKDVDTRKYEYFPYADKFITEHRKVREYLVQLKRGQNPEGVESYFYAQYAVADSELNRAAILSAHRAFLEFRNFSLERRRKILDDIRELLFKEKENLLQLMILEGHPRKLGEWEFSGMVTGCSKESLDYFQSEIIKTVGRLDGETMINILRPEGVVCVSPPKNASCSNSLMAILALLTANTLVIKPPLQVPVSTIYLWRNIVGKVLKANGAPGGTINIVVGSSKQFLEEWLESPHVRGIIFFNDSATGLEVGRKIFEKGKKPILELSGNDFMVVWKDAPIEEATDSLLDCFMGSTQICMVPKKALIHQDIYAQFMEVFLEKVKKLKFGLPSDPVTILSPVTKIAEFFEHLNDAIEKGAKLLTGGFRVNHSGEKDERGFYIAPTVIEVPVERANMMRCIQEENFFPLLPVIKVSSEGLTLREKDRSVFRKALQILEENQYGLRISVWVKDPFYLRKFIEEVHSSGLLRINSRHTGFSRYLSTHGGIGRSGGPFGEMNHIWQKTSHLQGISIKRLDVGVDTNTLSSPSPSLPAAPAGG